MAISLRTKQGRSIQIEDKSFASGGQGEIHRIIGRNGRQVAKLFFHESQDQLQKVKKLRSRIDFMINNSPLTHSPQNVRNALIWPSELLYKNGEFVGFTMPLAGDPQSKHTPVKLSNLTKGNLGRRIANENEWRKYDRTKNNALKTRLKLCYNIASAVNTLHSTKNYVLVDFKSDNILVNSNGWISIIDLDSIQISNRGRLLYQAPAFTEEYIPPEWQSKKATLSKTAKDETWDRFCYAVLAYQILLGIHPYTASHTQFRLQAELIERGLFPNGSKRNELLMIPPPHQKFNTLPSEIRALFIKCFDGGFKVPNRRPSLKIWADTILNILHKPPKIISLSANRTVRKDARPIRISWQVNCADKVFLNQMDVSHTHYVDVKPLYNTTYTLKAINYHKTITRQVKINVDRTPPKINFFTCDRSLLVDRNPAKLSWSVDNFQSLNINGVGNVSKKSKCTVAPKIDTEYRLTAVGHFGQVVYRKLYITTSKKAPQILRFSADRTFLDKPDKVVLSWKITGAERVYLNTTGQLNGNQNFTVKPTKDTKYILIAESYFGVKVQKTIEVKTSKNPPVIKFEYVRISSQNGLKKVKLQWWIQNAKSAKISQNIGPVGLKGERMITLKEDTEFKLKAVSHFGIKATQKVVVKIIKTPSFNRKEIKRTYTDFTRNHTLNTKNRKWYKK